MSKNLETTVLLREDKDGIATLTMNRGNKFNALSSELMAALQNQLDSIADDQSVRVVVIAGNGKAFCAGHDLAEMQADPDKETIHRIFSQCSRLMLTLTRIPQPVIARIQGVAAAAGCQLVAQCDLAVCVEEARFATSGINLGLFCATPMVAVTRNLPRKQAMELLMTGDMINADTALRYGLVNRVVPAPQLDNEVLALAERITSKSAAAVRYGKQLFYTQLEHGLEAAYKQATDVITNNMQTRDAQAGIVAFLNKQELPDWEDK